MLGPYLWKRACILLLILQSPVITVAAQTPLLGSSFGIPNVNSTFDYVVYYPKFIDWYARRRLTKI